MKVTLNHARAFKGDVHNTAIVNAAIGWDPPMITCPSEGSREATIVYEQAFIDFLRGVADSLQEDLANRTISAEPLRGEAALKAAEPAAVDGE